MLRYARSRRLIFLITPIVTLHLVQRFTDSRTLDKTFSQRDGKFHATRRSVDEGNFLREDRSFESCSILCNKRQRSALWLFHSPKLISKLIKFEFKSYRLAWHVLVAFNSITYHLTPPSSRLIRRASFRGHCSRKVELREK